MYVSRLHLHQFRSHRDAIYEFSSSVTAIVGPNGSGKTNILEAVYALCHGKSFRDGDDELITHGDDWYRIEASVEGVNRELRYQPSNKGKQLVVDGVNKGRFTYRQQLPVVLFEPDDLLMIHSSPSARRKYIDELLQKISLPYRQLLSRYERVLTQRNNILKQRLSPSELRDNLFVWDVSLADTGSKIIAMRLDVVEQINQRISQIYSEVAGEPQTVQLDYEVQEQTQSQLLAALHHALSDDTRRGFTTIGPHRHDVAIYLNDKLAKQTASRGEVRSILISLKRIELELLRDQCGDEPLLLLDDVFSELDEARQQHLVSQTFSQTILTSTAVSPHITAQVIELSR